MIIKGGIKMIDSAIDEGIRALGEYHAANTLDKIAESADSLANAIEGILQALSGRSVETAEIVDDYFDIKERLI